MRVAIKICKLKVEIPHLLDIKYVLNPSTKVKPITVARILAYSLINIVIIEKGVSDFLKLNTAGIKAGKELD